MTRKIFNPEELDWIVPGTVLTIASAAFALLKTPNYAGILSAFVLWMTVTAAMACVVIFMATVGMMRRRVEHPISHWLSFAAERRETILFVFAGVVLTGMNMVAFMWIKPLLNYHVPFRADPYLALVDREIFGTDPWRLLSWLNNNPLAYFYHRAWFGLMTLTLLTVLWKPASKEKSALMLTYFFLWSVFGPLMHTLLPAAGPVFYERLGYGTAFSGLKSASETKQLADYLWSIYIGGRFGPGSGISAMPSLHIATTVWIVLAVYLFARRWIVPTFLAAILIFMLSVALGWHYAIDGIVGGAGAIGIWWMARICLDRISGFAKTQSISTDPNAAV